LQTDFEGDRKVLFNFWVEDASGSLFVINFFDMRVSFVGLMN
jgi:hypothetical protein